MQSGALVLSGSSLSGQVIHKRADPLGTTASYVLLLILIILQEIPHASLFVPPSSFMLLCEHTGAGDNAVFQPNKGISLWFFLQPKEKDVIQTQSGVWL